MDDEDKVAYWYQQFGLVVDDTELTKDFEPAITSLNRLLECSGLSRYLRIQYMIDKASSTTDWCEAEVGDAFSSVE